MVEGTNGLGMGGGVCGSYGIDPNQPIESIYNLIQALQSDLPSEETEKIISVLIADMRNADPDVRQAVFDALTGIVDQDIPADQKLRIINALGEAIYDKNSQISRLAILALWRIGETSFDLDVSCAINTILEAAQQDPEIGFIVSAILESLEGAIGSNVITSEIQKLKLELWNSLCDKDKSINDCTLIAIELQANYYEQQVSDLETVDDPAVDETPKQNGTSNNKEDIEARQKQYEAWWQKWKEQQKWLEKKREAERLEEKRLEHRLEERREEERRLENNAEEHLAEKKYWDKKSEEKRLARIELEKHSLEEIEARVKEMIRKISIWLRSSPVNIHVADHLITILRDLASKYIRLQPDVEKLLLEIKNYCLLEQEHQGAFRAARG